MGEGDAGLLPLTGVGVGSQVVVVVVVVMVVLATARAVSMTGWAVVIPVDSLSPAAEEAVELTQ